MRESPVQSFRGGSEGMLVSGVCLYVSGGVCGSVLSEALVRFGNVSAALTISFYYK